MTRRPTFRRRLARGHTPRAQVEAEADFRQLKDRHVVSFSPMFHWTDQKIRVHVFYCVVALAIAHLMRRQAAQAGLHRAAPVGP